MTERADSPWYPGVVRLFRQTEMGEWGATVEAVAFNRTEPCPPQVRLAYQLEVNEWQGTRRLQLIVRHIESAG